MRVALTESASWRLFRLSANGAEVQAALFEITKQKTVPNVFVNGSHIGGSDVTIALFKKGVLAQLVMDGEAARDPPTTTTYDYDLIVIGGGSGGLACAKVKTQLVRAQNSGVFVLRRDCMFAFSCLYFMFCMNLCAVHILFSVAYCHHGDDKPLVDFSFP